MSLLMSLCQRNQTGSRILWFRLWMLPALPLPVPLDKSDGVSVDEIVPSEEVYTVCRKSKMY